MRIVIVLAVLLAAAAIGFVNDDQTNCVKKVCAQTFRRYVSGTFNSIENYWSKDSIGIILSEFRANYIYIVRDLLNSLESLDEYLTFCKELARESLCLHKVKYLQLRLAMTSFDRLDRANDIVVRKRASSFLELVLYNEYSYVRKDKREWLIASIERDIGICFQMKQDP